MADNKQQIPLFRNVSAADWNDIRVPREYIDHYKKWHECINCAQELRHEMHAFNHWRKYHRIPPVSTAARQGTQRLYAYINRTWVRVGILSFLYAKQQGIPTAFTKR